MSKAGITGVATRHLSKPPAVTPVARHLYAFPASAISHTRAIPRPNCYNNTAALSHAETVVGVYRTSWHKTFRAVSHATAGASVPISCERRYAQVEIPRRLVLSVHSERRRMHQHNWHGCVARCGAARRIPGPHLRVLTRSDALWSSGRADAERPCCDACASLGWALHTEGISHAVPECSVFLAILL